MPAVEHNARMRAYQLKAARPAGLGESLMYRVVADLVDGMRRCHRQGRVVRLVVANQGQLQSSMVEAGTRHRNEMAVPTQRFRSDLNLVAQPPDRRAGAERVLFDYCQRRSLSAGDNAIVWLDDRRLLFRDLFDRVAQIFLMVEVDVGYDSDPEVESVGSIEPATESDFANQKVDARSEVGDRQGREHLELG